MRKSDLLLKGGLEDAGRAKFKEPSGLPLVAHCPSLALKSLPKKDEFVKWKHITYRSVVPNRPRKACSFPANRCDRGKLLWCNAHPISSPLPDANCEFQI